MTTPFLEARLTRLRQALAEKQIDALLLTESDNVGYVSGFTGSTAYAVVTPAEAVLITDPRYTLRARAECPQFVVATAAGSGGYPEALTQALAERPHLKKLGFEAQQVTVAQWEKLKKDTPPTLEWVATEGLVEALRMVKDAGEVAIWKMRSDQNAGVLRQMYGASRQMHDFGRPAVAPHHPRLVQRPKVLDVMSNERPSVFGGTEENLNVRQSETSQFFGRIDIPALRSE